MRAGRNSIATAALIVAAIAPCATADGPATLTIDPARSLVNVTATVDGRAQFMSVAPGGSLVVATTPTTVSVRDLHLSLPSSLMFHVPFAPLGALDVWGSGLGVAWAAGAPPTAPTQVDGSGGFVVEAAPVQFAGSVQYSGAGLVCALLAGDGLACAYNGSLADSGSVQATLAPALIVIEPGTPMRMTITATLIAATPLRPPGGGAPVGSVAVAGTIVASGFIQGCAADFDGSGARTVGDIFAFLGAWFAGAPGTDMNGSGGRDVGDVFAFLTVWFRGCS